MSVVTFTLKHLSAVAADVLNAAGQAIGSIVARIGAADVLFLSVNAGGLTVTQLEELQQVMLERPASIPAEVWAEEVTRHKQRIYAAEVERRTVLHEQGLYQPRFGRFDEETGRFVPDIGADVAFDQANGT